MLNRKRYSLHNFIRKSVGARFMLVGMLNTLFGYSIFAVLIYLGLHYVLAILLSTTLGVCFNFFTIGKMVFRQAHQRLLFRFVCVYIVVYLLNIFLMKIANYYSHNNYLNGAACLPLTAATAFFLNKYFVFERPVYETH